jgi:two-component system sensor histidine kinase EvgS
LNQWLALKFSAAVADSDAPVNTEIDLSGLEQFVGADRELIDQLLRDVAVTNRSDRAELLQAHARGDHRALQVLSHRIKGGALMVRAGSLVECCERLERACGEGDKALIDASVDQLQQAMARLELSLEQD